MLDYHVHSQFSIDCDTPMEDSCRAAIAAGVTEIAFTDHIDHEPDDPGFGYYRADDYFRAIDHARARFGDRLTVLAGAEVDFNERTASQVERFLGQHSYDFVIGSVHYGDEGVIIFPDYFASRTSEDVFTGYLRQIALAVGTGWFDTIGHLDLPKRYAPRGHRNYDPLLYRELLEPVFASMVAKEVAFEINTSGLRQAPKTSMPGPAIVRWYVEAGGKLITTGTDSHLAKTVGAGLPLTLDMLEVCGIEHVAAFKGRRRRLVPLAELRQTAASAVETT